MKLLKKTIINLDNPIPVYDIEVDSPNHNFCLSNGVVVHNSKDIADAVSGAVYNLYQYIDKATLLSMKYKVNQFADQIESKSRLASNEFQEMIQGIY